MSIFLSKKLSVRTLASSTAGKTLWHYCPGCEERHAITIEPSSDPAAPPGPVWEYNDDPECPTFTPSVRHSWNKDGSKICHYFITEGRIEFCADSTHALAGYTLDLPNFPEYDIIPETNPVPL